MPVSSRPKTNKSSSKSAKRASKITLSSTVKTMPLQDEPPSTPRKRNNSLIPLELMMINNDEGGRERVALATVFGVPEYIDSKGLWDRQNEGRKQAHTVKEHNNNKHNTGSNLSVAGRPMSFAFGDDISHQSKFVSYVDSVLDHVGSNELLNPSLLGNLSQSTPTPTPTKSFALPRIPTVSGFDDLLSEDGITSPTTAFSTPITALEEQALPTEENKKEDVLLPNSKLNVIVGPPDIFDLIVSDQDERFIIWGPDPMLLSSSMATATPERPSSYATLYNNQYKRPELKGFSSNTTTTISSKKSSRSLIAVAQQLSGNKNAEDNNSSIFLKKAFGLKKRKKQEEEDQEQNKSTAEIPQVIEAASVHKLIEKLTNTLDYTLMTDFFLTYRDFLNSTDLCRLLVSRFYWALKNDEESRKIVRIRTFVVFRHWLNNYFVHDFIGNRPLRVILTNFLNELPHYPLVRQSPRDQRIVKILKRVLRRLKKLYYQRSTGASRVKVIPPPPPTAEQEQMGEIVRAKLSQSAIRRKTAIGVDMSSHYHGNMAVQDARYAPVVVVGSLNKKSSFIDSGVESSSMAAASRFMTQQSGDETTSMHYRYDKNVHKDTASNKQHQGGGEVSSVISVTSDDSLESDISAGDTIPNESDESEDEYHYHNESQTDDEHDREWLREQEETLEYFRLAKEKNLMPEEEEENQQPIVFDKVVESESSTPSTTPSTPELQQEQTPVLSKTIHRVPSERWCKSPDDLYPPNRHPLDATDTLPTEILQELSENEAKVPTGLSKRLSRKSIERRKSEKSLNASKNEAASSIPTPSTSLTNNPSSVPDNSDIPKVPDLPPTAPDMALTKKRSNRSLRRKKSATVKSPKSVEPIETFAAIPYELTQAPDELKNNTNEETQQDNKSPKLSRVLSKVFKHGHPEENKASITNTNDSEQAVEKAAEEPTVENSATDTSSPEQQQSSQLVSLIARRLRYDSIDESIHPGDESHACECAQCSGNKDSTAFCRRLSVMMVRDDERRQSLELRRKRGASIFLEQQPKNNVGPVYLGHLHPNASETDIVAPTVSVKAVSTVGSAKSIQTDFPASSVRGHMSMVSEFTESPRRFSKVTHDGGLEKTVTKYSEAPSSVCAVVPQTGRCFIMSYRTSTLASQFCFVERDVLVKVGWEELIHCKWTKMDPTGQLTAQLDIAETEQRQQHMNYTRQKRNQEQGIEQVIQRFNMVCQWVATEIVRTKNTHERVKLIEKFIKLAKKCQLYSNYATLVQILLGLQSPAVARLEKTWSKVSPKYQKILSKLTEFTSPMKNWKHIRDSMTEVAEEYGNTPAEVQVELPGTSSHNKFTKTTRIKIPFGGCIPFLGIYLSDLVFNFEKPRYLKPNLDNQKIYMANNTRKLPACLEEPLVNFRKHRVIATVVKRVLTFQSLAMRYSFDEDLYLIEKCRNLQVLDAATIRELSNSLE